MLLLLSMLFRIVKSVIRFSVPLHVSIKLLLLLCTNAYHFALVQLILL